MNHADPRRQRIGTVLVAFQFALIGALGLYGAPAFLRGNTPVGAWGLAAAGAILGGWALYCNRPGNFNIHPTPRPGGQLVRKGPYRLIRHPMYTAVLLCGLALAWACGSVAAWSGWVVLLAVLAVKAAVEERWMLSQHPDYIAYRVGTWRFVPGLY
ncbi:MAG: isoprenylcysteine carboxylmethyltransferase family protein [Burkholderiaceae bacterium]